MTVTELRKALQKLEVEGHGALPVVYWYEYKGDLEACDLDNLSVEPTPTGPWRLGLAIVRAITGGPLSLRLGGDHNEAAAAYARLIVVARERSEAVVPGTVGELVERAHREFLPRIENEETRAWRERHVDALGKAFGSRRYAKHVYEATKAPGAFLQAIDVQRYLDQNRERPAAANREVKTWGMVFAEARRRWGLTEYNPCAGLEFHEERGRRDLPAPSDRDIARAYRRLDPPMRFAVAMIRYCGRRRGEILGLTLGSAQEDGLHFVRGKRRREIVMVWDARLKRAWERLMRWRAARVRGGKVQTTAALVNRLGGRLTTTGFNSAWRRARERSGVDFNFHDIRATRASTLPRGIASEVLAHDDHRTTEAIYRRGPLVIDISRSTGHNSRKPKAGAS